MKTKENKKSFIKILSTAVAVMVLVASNNLHISHAESLKNLSIMPDEYMMEGKSSEFLSYVTEKENLNIREAIFIDIPTRQTGYMYANAFSMYDVHDVSYVENGIEKTQTVYLTKPSNSLWHMYLLSNSEYFGSVYYIDAITKVFESANDDISISGTRSIISNRGIKAPNYDEPGVEPSKGYSYEEVCNLLGVIPSEEYQEENAYPYEPATYSKKANRWIWY